MNKDRGERKQRTKVIELAKQIGLDIRDGGIENVMECLAEDDGFVSPNEHDRESADDESSEKTQIKKFRADELNETFTLISQAMRILENQDPNTERFTKTARGIENSLRIYKENIRRKRMINTNFDWRITAVL